MKIKTIVPCSLVNGENCRMIIVFQGCKLRCSGCFSQELKDFNLGREVSPKRLAFLIARDYEKDKLLDGITLSGGNPPDQDDLTDFLIELKKLLPTLNIWMYTGYTWKETQDSPELKEHLEYVDNIVTGRYLEELKRAHHYYGSSNQEVYTKTDNKWNKNEKD